MSKDCYKYDENKAENMMITAKPPGAQTWIDGSFYKIGLRNKPFMWCDNEWVCSEKSLSEVSVSIKAMDEKIKKAKAAKRRSDSE